MPPHGSVKIDRLYKRLQVRLPQYEICIYVIVLCVGFSYSAYNVLLASNNYFKRLPARNKKVDLLGKSWPVDATDTEWVPIHEHYMKAIPVLVFHLLMAQLIRCFVKSETILSLFYLVFSMTYISLNLSFGLLLWLLLQPILIFMVTILFRSITLVWLTNLYFILCINHFTVLDIYDWCMRFNDPNTLLPPIHEIFSLVTFFWISLRCVSFGCDVIHRKLSLLSILQMAPIFLAYCFYLPNCFGGPIYNFSNFVRGIKREFHPWRLRRLGYFTLHLIRIVIWAKCLHFMLHFFRHTALSEIPSILTAVDRWTLLGLGFCVSIQFFFKYMFIYGLANVFALADGFDDFPPPPACVVRICYSSEMWRRFDVGLYEFIILYIYRPITDAVGNHDQWFTRLFASVVTFSYIYVWHGMMRPVFIWTIFKFICITLETIGSGIRQNESFCKFEIEHLSPPVARRIRALISTPLYVIATTSHYIFLANENFAYVVASRCIFSYDMWPIGLPSLLLFIYCQIQVSVTVKNIEILNQIKKYKQHHH